MVDRPIPKPLASPGHRIAPYAITTALNRGLPYPVTIVLLSPTHCTLARRILGEVTAPTSLGMIVTVCIVKRGANP